MLRIQGQRVGNLAKAPNLPTDPVVVKWLGRPLAECGIYFRTLALVCKNAGQGASIFCFKTRKACLLLLS